MILVFTALVLGLSMNALAVQPLSEQELGEISGQDGATFILQNFDFYLTSPGVQYLATHIDDPTAPAPANPKPDDQRGSMDFQDLTISDGNRNPVILSASLDWDIYSMSIGDTGYNYARFDLYNIDGTMDIDVDNIAVSPLDPATQLAMSPADLGGMHIDGLAIDRMTATLGASTTNTGVAGQIDLAMRIDGLTIDAFRHLATTPDTPVTFTNIMVAGYFTGSEPAYDSTLPLAYTETPGIWSEQRAYTYAGGGTANYNEALYNQLINANRWTPDPASWVPHGVLQIGDVDNGNPMRMDFTVDRNEFIPFPYDILSGEPTQDERVEWYEPVSGDLFSDARGWRDGKDNYVKDGTNYHPIKNPRFGKAYISMDAPVMGSLRIGETGGDILIVDGINLQIHAEIPGYGYGDTPNSIPRPYPDPQLEPPLYDAPFDTYWQ